MNKVHVVFKTHLDLGFTDLASNVLDNYNKNYIPQAVKLAFELNQPGEKPKFIWTTGSYLIWQYLNTQSPEQVAKLTAAIEQEYICWHALPVTFHSEAAGQFIFTEGMNITAELDKRFNRQTITGKMTDVPGHTKGIVPLLGQKGVKFLHIGMNGVSAIPDVPRNFIWEHDGEQLIVSYSYDYGTDIQIEGCDDILVFAHTHDNSGPQSKAKIEKVYIDLAKKYPGYEIVASTMDNYVRTLLQSDYKLPIITEEIGDSWIHGVASDPKKMSDYHILSDLMQTWLKDGIVTKQDDYYQHFISNMMLVPEHTWGMDIKRYFSDYKNYPKADFYAAKAKNKIEDEALTFRYQDVGIATEPEMKYTSFEWNQRTYQLYESSWQEQRTYLELAINSLPVNLQTVARDALTEKVIASSGRTVNAYEAIEVGDFIVKIDQYGAICSLINGKVEYASEQNTLFNVQYTVVGNDSYEKLRVNYLRDLDKHFWAIDFLKPGIELQAEIVETETADIVVSNIKVNANTIYVEAYNNLKYADKFGAPRTIIIEYVFTDKVQAFINLLDKDASRYPEIITVGINPVVNNYSRYTINKLGTSINPQDIVGNGSKIMHAIDNQISYQAADKCFEIRALNSKVMSIGQIDNLDFKPKHIDIENGFYFHLLNTTWGTNFTMWYDQDIHAAFEFVPN